MLYDILKTYPWEKGPVRRCGLPCKKVLFLIPIPELAILEPDQARWKISNPLYKDMTSIPKYHLLLKIMGWAITRISALAKHKFLDALRISITLSILVLSHIYIKNSKICVL